jgi:hypothetical protein
MNATNTLQSQYALRDLEELSKSFDVCLAAIEDALLTSEDNEVIDEGVPDDFLFAV